MSTTTLSLSVSCRNENELNQLKTAISSLVTDFGVPAMLTLFAKAKGDALVKASMKVITALAAPIFPGRSQVYQLAVPLPAGVTSTQVAQLTTAFQEVMKEYGGSKGMLALHKRLTSDASMRDMVRQYAKG